MKVFTSGSCRLVTVINDGRDKIIPIHSMKRNFHGINFLGKLHNTKQHIQFIQYIHNNIVLPNDILPKFLTSYTNHTDVENKNLLPLKKENIKNEFNNCEWYIFEICSLKLYRNNGFEVQSELTDDYTCTVQTSTELLEDIQTIRELIPENKKILFQVHFRPNIIYNDLSQSIDARETIYNVVNQFCKNNKNTFIYDPSILLQTDHQNLLNKTTGVHFTEQGYIQSFHYINTNYFNCYK